MQKKLSITEIFEEEAEAYQKHLQENPLPEPFSREEMNNTLSRIKTLEDKLENLLKNNQQGEVQ